MNPNLAMALAQTHLDDRQRERRHVRGFDHTQGHTSGQNEPRSPAGRGLAGQRVRTRQAMVTIVATLMMVAVLGAAASTSWAATSAYGFAYVVNSSSNSVSEIDLATNTLVRTIGVGAAPTAIAVTPDGQTAYVTDSGSNAVTPIHLATGVAGAAIPVGSDPSGIAITPDGTAAYVTDQTGNTVTEINLSNGGGTVVARIPVAGGPDGIAITPNGATAYVTDTGSDTVTPITVADDAVGTPIPVGTDPISIAVTPNGQTALAVDNTSGTVTPIDVATHQPGSAVAVGRDPHGIAIAPDGQTAYVADFGSHTLSKIDVATDTAEGAVPLTGSDPYGVAVTPNGFTAYVTNDIGNSVTPVSLSNDETGNAITVGAMPVAVAISPPAPSVSVSCDPASVVAGQAASCTATVTDASGGDQATPTGTVSFTATGTGGFDSPSCTLSSAGADASCAVDFTPGANGTYEITAAYGGDTAHPAGQGQAALPVSLRTTRTTLTCSETNLQIGQSTTCTATVTDTDAAGQDAAPSGRVTFGPAKNNGYAPAHCALSAISASSSSCQTTYSATAAPGKHTLTATYSGSKVYRTSQGKLAATITTTGTA